MKSRGWIIDLVISIGQDLALTSHLQENLNKLQKDKDMNTQKIIDVESLLIATIEARRRKMAYLVEQSPEANLDFWCSQKHQIFSWELDCEVWEATYSQEAQKIMFDSYKRLAQTLSLFLGIDVIDCWSCLADRLLSGVVQSPDEA